MKILSKDIFNKWFLFIFCLSFISLIFGIFLFFYKVDNFIEAVLQVDSNKNFSIELSTSNLTLFSNDKNLLIFIEGKSYLLTNCDFIYKGNNRYIISFDNINLYHLLKSSSLYQVKIFLGSKKILDFIFNI